MFSSSSTTKMYLMLSLFINFLTFLEHYSG